MAQCTEWPCDFRTDSWEIMRYHYKRQHPQIKRPDKLFAYSWRHELNK